MPFKTKKNRNKSNAARIRKQRQSRFTLRRGLIVAARDAPLTRHAPLTPVANKTKKTREKVAPKAREPSARVIAQEDAKQLKKMREIANKKAAQNAKNAFEQAKLNAVQQARENRGNNVAQSIMAAKTEKQLTTAIRNAELGKMTALPKGY
jgi:hypothetical protein